MAAERRVTVAGTLDNTRRLPVARTQAQLRLGHSACAQADSAFRKFWLSCHGYRGVSMSVLKKKKKNRRRGRKKGTNRRGTRGAAAGQDTDGEIMLRAMSTHLECVARGSCAI